MSKSGMSKKKTKKARQVVAEALLSQGVEYVFGIVGYPIIELGYACQNVGLKYVGCRNEQAASYAAAAVGYLTGRPGACLVVPGPGVIHALAGLANAASNGWPMICIAGSSELSQDGLGAFQESLPPQGGAQIQAQYAVPMCKYVAKCTQVERIPFYVEQAVRYAINGRPGGVYLEVAGDSLREPAEDVYFPPMCADPPHVLAPPSEIERALRTLQGAESPLIIVGKGAAYAGAAPGLREFVRRTNMPFLPSPMGKGVLPDDHELNSSSARSHVLRTADVILLVGARLNWILHYGRPPRYKRGVKFIHVEILPEEVGHSLPAEVALVGHAQAIVGQLNAGLDSIPVSVSPNSPWMNGIAEVGQKSKDLFLELSTDRSSPMNYYCALGIIDRLTPHDAIIMNEGSDTMDIGRTVLKNYEPRMRLDAASWGTMGVGMGQAIAGAMVNPQPGCVAVFGDSAFGFSGMEFEVVTRLQLPVVVVIINNNGIGGQNPETFATIRGQPLGTSTADRLKHPAKSLTPSAHYEGIATALGATGVFVDSADGLEREFSKAMSIRPFKPTIINCMISVTAGRGKSSPAPFAKVAKL